MSDDGEFCECGLLVHRDDKECPCCHRRLIWDDEGLRCVEGESFLTECDLYDFPEDFS